MKNLYKYKDYFIGLLIYLLPLSLIIKPENLRQFAVIDAYLFLFSIIAIFFIIIFFYFILYKIFFKIFKKKIYNLFSLLCFGYSLLFIYAPIHNILTIYFFQKGGATYSVVILLFVLWFFTCFIILNFSFAKNIFYRSIFFFCLINIMLSFYYIIIFVNSINDEKYIFKNQSSNLLNSKNILSNISLNNNKINNNIYYIILDGMLSLELAKKYNIIDNLNIKLEFEKLGLKYIENSISSYSNTYLTLASIMELDYPITEKSEKYINRGSFFPMMMYQNKNKIPLPEIVDAKGGDFYWIGNSWGPCMEWVVQPWKCTQSKTYRNFMRLGSTIFFNTPLKAFIINWLPSNQIREGGQRNIKYYINNFKNINSDSGNFTFIHQMSPHAPYNVTKNCNKKNYSNLFEGYKASYKCTLKEILIFIEYISKLDPNAIIVFQADHGPDKKIIKKFDSEKEKYFFKSNIFNAIKAPEKCFEKFNIPLNNINTIRFVVNCAYGLRLLNLEHIHYTGFYENDSLYGQVIRNKVNN